MSFVAKLIGADAPKMPELPPPPPPPPTREDPAVEEAKKRLAESERKRRGRRAAMGDVSDSDLGAAPVSRPMARAAQGLGA
jgi:type IV secretory pathway VirB10-like protein